MSEFVPNDGCTTLLPLPLTLDRIHDTRIDIVDATSSLRADLFSVVIHSAVPHA